MFALILALYMIYPTKLVTIPTGSIPQKYQISIFDAGVTLGRKVFIKIDPILLPADLSLGMRFVSSNLFFGINLSAFYGVGYIKPQGVDKMSINANGFNIVAGYTKFPLTGAVYFREYGERQSLGIMSGIFIRPLIAEVGFDSYEALRFGGGVFLTAGRFFVKIGAFSSTKMLKDGKFPFVPVLNMGVKK